MPRYSKSSEAKLNTCHPLIQGVFHEAIKHIDLTILEGFRGERRQNRYFDEGKTQVQWPDSSHNHTYPEGFPCSKAVDAAPYPIDWEDRERFTLFAGFILGIASQMGVKLRWGGDWNQDTEVKDNRFDDLPHFELVD